MILRALTILSALTISPFAEAASYRCQTKGFCTNALSCKPDDAYFVARTIPGGRMQFGWEDSDARFAGTPIRKDQVTLYVATDAPGSVQTFALAYDLSATMSVISVFDDQFYHSFQAMTCVEVTK